MNIHNLDPEKIMFAGDWHGNLYQAETVINIAALKGAKTVVQLGDFGFWNNNTQTGRYLKGMNNIALKHDVIVLWVDGNHEDFDHLDIYPIDEFGTRKIRSNIYHLPRGLTFTWSGVKFTALGGGYSVDQHLRIPYKSWWPQELATKEDLDKVVASGKTDVLLMHDSPAGAPNPVVDDPFNKGHLYFPANQLVNAATYREFLRPTVEAVDPVFIVHGHYHKYGSGRYTQPSGTKTDVLSLDEGTAPHSKHMRLFTLKDLQNIVKMNRGLVQ